MAGDVHTERDLSQGNGGTSAVSYDAAIVPSLTALRMRATGYWFSSRYLLARHVVMLKALRRAKPWPSSLRRRRGNGRYG
jgi:hypothetical protein